MIDYLPYGGLADGAGDGNNLEIHQSAIFSSEVTESFYGIIYLQQAKAGGINIPVDDGANSTFSEGVINIVVAIEIIAGEGEEAIAGLDSSRIGTYTYEGTVTGGSQSAARILHRVSFYYTGEVFD